MQCEVIDTIPKGLEPYRPTIYRGFVITDENDGYFRVYTMAGRQLGWSTNLDMLREMIGGIAEEVARR